MTIDAMSDPDRNSVVVGRYKIQAKRQRAQASAKSEAEKKAASDNGVPQPWHKSN